MVNIPYVRRQVERAIDTAPIYITIMRPVYEDDGMGGRKFIENSIFQRDAKVLFDNTNQDNINIFITDSGKSPDEPTPKLFMMVDPYDITGSPYRNDYFIFHGDRYRFDKVVNVLELGIVWQINLSLQEVLPHGIE